MWMIEGQLWKISKEESFKEAAVLNLMLIHILQRRPHFCCIQLSVVVNLITTKENAYFSSMRLTTVYKIHNFGINFEWEQARKTNPSR
jgi:hypothetical protein